MTAHYNSQFVSAFIVVCSRKPKNASGRVLMGPKHNLVHFKSLLGCLLINSWSSSQQLYAGKNIKGNSISTFPPCLSFHIGEVIQIWLARWMGSLRNIFLSYVEECRLHYVLVGDIYNWVKKPKVKISSLAPPTLV